MKVKMRRPTRDRHSGARQNGFTLIELMVTLAVAAILLTVAAPSFWAVIQDNRLTAQANDFVTDAYRARSEAVTRGRQVTMCRCVTDSTGKCDQTGGDYTCDTSGDTNWDQGWIVFVDLNEDAEHQGATEQIIRIRDRLPSEFDLTGDVAAVEDFISYNSRGIASQSGALTLENADRHTAGGKILERTIRIKRSGAVETCNPNRASCS